MDTNTDNKFPHNDLADSGEYEYSEYEGLRDMEIRRRMLNRRREAERKRVMRNRTVALLLLLVIVFIIVKSCAGGGEKKPVDNSSDSSLSESSSESKKADDVSQSVSENQSENKSENSEDEQSAQESKHNITEENGMTFVDGILIVNKTYSLPADYDPGVSAVAQNAFQQMAEDASKEGINLFILSGYRSYERQEELYNSYVSQRGQESADEVSSRPGHSEHQTGLTFDVNSTDFSFEDTPEANWLAEHCAEYGFIIRYPKGKEDITGYAYEAWHIRYLGVENAQKVTESGLCLEEYLGITSDYADSEDLGDVYSHDIET